MAHTGGDHTQHLARMHRHRARVNAHLAQIDADTATAPVEPGAKISGKDTTSGPLRPGSEAPNVRQ